MLAELMARSGNSLLDGIAPNGKDYWAARFWDRDAAEQHPLLRDSFLQQKETIAGYLSEYGRETERVLEFCCGTGEFTRLAAKNTTAREITALDISEQGLARTRQRVEHDNLRLVQGDFWQDNDLGTADLVMCVDAIHHLGDVRQVLTLMKTFVAPGGLFVGNLWIADNFHEFGRKRYGTLAHLRRTAGFLSTALMIRLSAGRLRTSAYRTQLIRSDAAETMLRELFGEVLELDVHRYFMSFVCRP